MCYDEIKSTEITSSSSLWHSDNVDIFNDTDAKQRHTPIVWETGALRRNFTYKGLFGKVAVKQFVKDFNIRIEKETSPISLVIQADMFENFISYCAFSVTLDKALRKHLGPHRSASVSLFTATKVSGYTEEDRSYVIVSTGKLIPTSSPQTIISLRELYYKEVERVAILTFCWMLCPSELTIV